MTSKPTAAEIEQLRTEIAAAQDKLQAEREDRPHDYVHAHEMHFLVAKHINRVRKRKGLSMRAFAEAVGVDKAQLTRWLSGRKNLTLNSIARMQAALGEPVVMVADETYRSFENRGLKGSPHCWFEEDGDDNIVLFVPERQTGTSVVHWKANHVVKTSREIAADRPGRFERSHVISFA